jgi:hypothetical protein
MTRRHLAVVAALAALVAATAVVSASGATADHTIRLDFKLQDVKVVDAAPKGQSRGDYGVISGTLSAPGSHKQAGHYQGICFTTTPPAGSECTITYSLAGGQITTTTAYGKGFNGDAVSHDAIVGGTRRYANARGELVGRETGDTTGTMTIHLAR